jgi:hypothetical protein
LQTAPMFFCKLLFNYLIYGNDVVAKTNVWKNVFIKVITVCRSNFVEISLFKNLWNMFIIYTLIWFLLQSNIDSFRSLRRAKQMPTFWLKNKKTFYFQQNWNSSSFCNQCKQILEENICVVAFCKQTMITIKNNNKTFGNCAHYFYFQKIIIIINKRLYV